MKKLILILVLGLVSCQHAGPPFVIYSATKLSNGMYIYTIWNKVGHDVEFEFVSPEQYKVGDTLYFTTNRYCK